MNINFYLDQGNIYLRCYPKPYSECKFYLGQKVDPKLWSKSKGRMMVSAKGAQAVNKYIDAVESFIESEVLKARTEMRPLSGFELKAMLHIQFIAGPEEKPKEYNLEQFMDYFLETRSVTAGTRNGYRSKLRSVMKHFPGLDFPGITMKWRVESEKILQQHYKINNIHKTYVILKDLLNLADELGVYKIDVQRNKKWLPRQEAVDNIYLTEQEIDQLYSYNFEPRLRKAVDLFVLGCETGQRYSDFSRINKSMVVVMGDTRMIRLITQKSGLRKKSVSIPITARMDEILERSPSLTMQKLNEYIKEAARIAGLDKWDRITSHTPRRSYATNQVLKGTNTQLIMAVTGHDTEKEFWKYVKVKDLMAAVEIQKAVEIKKAQSLTN